MSWKSSEYTIIIGPSKSVLVYALHSLVYVLGLARFRVFAPRKKLKDGPCTKIQIAMPSCKTIVYPFDDLWTIKKNFDFDPPSKSVPVPDLDKC